MLKGFDEDIFIILILPVFDEIVFELALLGFVLDVFVVDLVLFGIFIVVEDFVVLVGLFIVLDVNGFDFIPDDIVFGFDGAEIFLNYFFLRAILFDLF